MSHFDDSGASRMVDVGQKPITSRAARAQGTVRMEASTVQLICGGQAKKGDVLEVARLAGIMAAKRTAELVPLCHSVPLDAVEISFSFPGPCQVAVEASVRARGRTGVEMEAMVAVAAATLTVYDMCKSVDRGMTIESIQLEEKSGGRSGHFQRDQGSTGNSCCGV
jgi:cyclic pyranopterin phosphate synthase